MYIKRHISKTVERMAQMFGAVIVTGARQVGKTTMLMKTAGSGVKYLTMDDPVQLQAAKNDPASFPGSTDKPLFIDEIQYAPELLPFIKMKIDGEHRKGAFLMSGPQQFHLMKNVSESLAGRAGILTMPGLSSREIAADNFDLPFMPDKKYLDARIPGLVKCPLSEIWRRIHRGFMPELYADPDFDWEFFWSSYTRTYLERDVRALTQVGDVNSFLRFMTVCAARTGGLLNMSALARDTGVSVPTAERWLSVLEASHLVYLLQPYYENITSRMVKSPKLYFMDTGLAAYLTRWTSPEVLEHGAMAGPFFESHVVAEIIKSYYNAGIERPPLYYYRDKDRREIDLLIAENNVLHPIEIKKHCNPRRDDTSAFAALGEKIRGSGAVISLYEDAVPLGDKDVNVPVWAI